MLLTNQPSKRPAAKAKSSMTETLTHTYLTDDILREHVLTNDRLMLAEIGFPGMVRVLASGRYHARLEVDGWGYDFNIVEHAHLERELVSKFPDSQPLLSALAWHKAAEAMLAHRKGHLEARLNKKLRRPKTKQDD